MKRTLWPALVALAFLTCAGLSATATSRIKDLANIEGIRQNQLIGYGLVVGLNGTGDTLNNTPFTKQSLQGMLERLGVNIRGQQIRTGNVAAVMVTANLPAFATQGTRIDVTASAMGDSKSLLGGTLLVTPLLGADGNVYAVAQGSLAIGGFQAEGEAAKSPAAYRRSADCPTAPSSNARSNSRWRRSASCGCHCATPISPRPNGSPSRSTIIIGSPVAEPLDPSTVQLTLPQKFPQNLVAHADRDRAAAGRARRGGQDRHRRTLGRHRHRPRRAGLTVAVAQGNLTVTISETPQVSQPAPSPAAARRGAAHQVGVQRTAKSSRSCARASHCSRSSTGSTRSASGRAI